MRKNWTSLMKPLDDVAEAVIDCGRLTPNVTPLAGEVTATPGAVPPLTEMVTAALVVMLPPLSVARAVKT